MLQSMGSQKSYMTEVTHLWAKHTGPMILPKLIQSYLLPLSSHFYFTYLISIILPRVLVWVKYNIVKSIWVREHSQPPSCDLTLCLIPSPSYLLVNLSSLIN